MIIFVIYEWCYAALAVMLHQKIKKTGSLLLAGGLAAMACLVTIRFIGTQRAPDSVFITKTLPVIMMIVPLFALTGLGLVVAQWEKYTGKK